MAGGSSYPNRRARPARRASSLVDISLGDAGRNAMSIVREFEAAFNRADVGALVACFTPGATYVDSFYGAHTGEPALRAMFERMFHEGRDYRWTMEVVVEDRDHATAEWAFRYVVTDAVPRSAGRTISFKGMSVFELERGKIARYREYFDTGVALLQLGFAPDAMAKVLGRRLTQPRITSTMPETKSSV